MRVFHINSVVNTGSTGRIVEDIGRVLIEKGHQSYIAFGRDLGSLQSTSILVKIGNKLNVIWHGINTLLLDNHAFVNDFATKKLIKRIELIQPDVVALYNLHGYYINVEYLFRYLRKKGIPVVWTLFDCWAFTGHCTYFDNIGCIKWKTSCTECPKYNVYPRSFVDNSRKNYQKKKELFNNLTNLQIITHSNWLRELVSESFLGGHQIHLIHSAVDLKIFKPTNFKLSNRYDFLNKKILLGCANIWTDRKGFKDFLNLANMCKSDTIIVLVGVSQDQKKLLPSNIIGITRTENTEELAMWYSLADVFVNLTYMDNFPTTNIEALACGTPVITYNTGGSPESIDENTGFVVEKGDLIGVINSINILMKRNKDELSINCRKRALTMFDKETRFLDYIKVFENSI